MANKLCPSFYDIFRCGLVHEGRIKEGYAISYRFSKEVIKRYHENYILNPLLFTEMTRKAINYCLKYIALEPHKIGQFRINLKRMLKEDYPCLNRTLDDFLTPSDLPNEVMEISQ